MLNEVRPVIIPKVGSNTAEKIARILISALYCQSGKFEHRQHLRKKEVGCLEVS
jgi:hypothetical protein